MSATILRHPIAERLAGAAWIQRRRWQTRLWRARVALAYLTGRADENHGRALLRAGCEALESWSLVSIDAEGVLEAARERWADHPELPRLCSIAAHHVARKWSDDGETRGAAEDWALQVVAEDARLAGVCLSPLDDAQDDDA